MTEIEITENTPAPVAVNPATQVKKRSRARNMSPKAKDKSIKRSGQRKAAAKEGSPRREGKGAKILELIGRGKGATLVELMKATGWQAHSVRGFLSTASKKQSIKLESAKNDSGERVYHVSK